MTAPAFLTDDDVRRLTGRQRHGAQRRALDRMGIHYWQRPDGRPVVSRALVEQRAENEPAPIEPNWGALQ